MIFTKYMLDKYITKHTKDYNQSVLIIYLAIKQQHWLNYLTHNVVLLDRYELYKNLKKHEKVIAFMQTHNTFNQFRDP